MGVTESIVSGFFFFQAEDGIRDLIVTGVQTCALPICPGWTVKEVAAHLLDTNIRNLSMRRDGYFGEKPAGADSYESLVRFLDRLNAEWVKAARRISPRVLIDWLEMTSREACEF